LIEDVNPKASHPLQVLRPGIRVSACVLHAHRLSAFCVSGRALGSPTYLCLYLQFCPVLCGGEWHLERVTSRQINTRTEASRCLMDQHCTVPRSGPSTAAYLRLGRALRGEVLLLAHVVFVLSFGVPFICILGLPPVSWSRTRSWSGTRVSLIFLFPVSPHPFMLMRSPYPRHSGVDG
jgi:hypothetical protein